MAQEPYLYEIETFAAGVQGIRPAFSFDPVKWERLACDTLSADARGYIFGNAGRGETDENNRHAFRRWAIIPTRLVQVQYPRLATTVLGESLTYPIALAPIGVQKIFHRDGEVAVARAARKLGVPYILSSATCTSFEDAARANGTGSQRWYQLYWPSNSNNDFTVSLLNRAKAAGYTALFVTIDTFAMGWRYMDLDHGYNPFLVADHVGVEIGLTDELFQQRFRGKYGHDAGDDLAKAAKEWASITTPGMSHTWEDLKFLRKHWEGPIVLKGIQSVTDAKKAVEYGMQGIVVSNHGGRQQDGIPASLDSLPAIVNAVGQELDVLFDSGIRSGVDVAKVLGLGAKCVLLGRPYIWGLAIGGQAGVEHVIKSVLGELQMTLHQAGIASVSPTDLNRDILLRHETIPGV